MIEPDHTRVRVVSAAEVEKYGRPELALTPPAPRPASARTRTSEIKRMNFRLPGGWMRVLGAALPSIGVFGYKEFHYSRAARCATPSTCSPPTTAGRSASSTPR